MSKIFDEIVNMVEERYFKESNRLDYISKYDENDVHIATAISTLLGEKNIPYTIEQEDCFESPGYDTGAVFAAWIENGMLESISYQYELM